jgi:hypothetical protein
MDKLVAGRDRYSVALSLQVFVPKPKAFVAREAADFQFGLHTRTSMPRRDWHMALLGHRLCLKTIVYRGFP